MNIDFGDTQSSIRADISLNYVETIEDFRDLRKQITGVFSIFCCCYAIISF